MLQSVTFQTSRAGQFLRCHSQCMRVRVYVCPYGCVHIHICVFGMCANVDHAMAIAERLKSFLDDLRSFWRQ